MHTLRELFWKATTIVVVLSTLVVAVPVSAATVISAGDFPTQLETSTAANHRVVFQTPTGAAEGETIVLTFESAFDTASIVEDDVDIDVDGVDLTTAANCAGAEQASVVMAADVLTITICAGDGGAIAINDVVTIDIGTHTVDSGTGTNQIVNPSGEGTYYIGVSGTFGDTASIPVPIVDASVVTVNAEVTGQGGGGDEDPPDGGGGCADTTDPVISNVSVTAITSSEATITWNTNENADSKVDYGLTDSYELGTVSNPTLETSHSIDLSGLSEGTTYHFRVRSADSCPNEAESADATFTTLDETACVISNVAAVDITTSSARIVWTTDEPADSLVEYGLTTSYGSSESDPTLETDHSIILTGLAEATTYHFRVTCEDASGNSSTSPDETFQTENDPAPANVTNLTADPDDASCALDWNNPSDDDLDGILVLQCTNDYPSSPTDPDCTEVFDGMSENTTETGLVNGTTYYYGVFAYDDAGQFASGALVACSPSAPEEEQPPAEELPPEEPPADGGSTDQFCGDGICSATESAASCPADCAPEEETEVIPPVEIPPTTVGGGELIPETDVEFYVASGAIQLSVTSSAEVHLLSHRPLRVHLLTRQIQKDVDRVQLVFGAEAYNMAPNFSEEGDSQAAAFRDPAYVAEVVTPSPAAYALAVSILYTDGTSQTLSFLADVEEDGYTYQTVEGTTRRVDGSLVSLFENGVVTWDGSPFVQSNPLITGTDGAFAWYVPNGTYTVEAEKSGFESASSGMLLISDNIVNPAVRMVAEVVTPLEEIPVVGEAVQAIETVTEVLQMIRESEQAQTAATVVVPALIATAVVSAAALALAFDLIPFLQYLFTSPFLFFWRRKRKGFGIVYNSISKVPIDLAIVRLYRLPDVLPEGPLPVGRLAQSRVTDKGGRYFFLVQPCQYRITAVKNGFTFPTEYLSGDRNDGEFLDVYHGEVVQVKERDAVLTANIPMDPSQAGEYHKPKKIRWMQRMRVAQNFIAVVGIVLAIGVLIVRPSVLAAVLVVLQVGIYVLVHRLARAKKPKSWGIVYDKTTKRPLGSVVVRVFEPTYNKLLETTVTDSKGRYSALLGPNEYFTVYEREGYEPVEVRPIDYKQKKEPTELAVNVEMALKGSESTTEPPSSSDV